MFGIPVSNIYDNESRDDVYCDIRVVQDWNTTIETEKSCSSSFSESFMYSTIMDVEDQIDEAIPVAESLRYELAASKTKLDRLRRTKEREDKDTFSKLQNILFRQVPAYQNFIPPINYETSEHNDKVGSYQIHDCLGKGYFAEVVLCQHERTKFLHAMKCLKKRMFTSTSALEQLAREIQVLRSDVHPNIIKCEEVIHASDCIYIVMELGCMDLIEYLDNYSHIMTESVHREIAFGLISGLECLHFVGVAHMDIKPDNIIIAHDIPPQKLSSADIKICDFGLCLISESPEKKITVSEVVGTPRYMSPELKFVRAEGVRVEGRRVDMWAVGVTLMGITEKIPFDWPENYNSKSFICDLRSALITVQSQTDIPSDSVRNLLRGMLRWEPKSRLTAIQALQHSCFDNMARRDWSR